MLRLKVTNQDIILEEVTPLGVPLVSGSAGEYECIFEFDDSWKDFTKMAVFKILPEDGCNLYCEKEIKQPDPVILENDKCIIPPKALKKDTKLQIGVYGVKDKIQRPTIYTTPLLVRVGAMPVQPDNDDVVPEIYLQMLKIMNETQQIAQSVRDDADAGKFNGKGIPTGGATGQILFKKSDASYDTQWGDVPTHTWDEIKEKPFDTLSPDEMEVVIEGGIEPFDPQTKVLGIKAVGMDKVTGLQDALDGKIAEVKVNGSALVPSQGSVDVAIPTKVSQVENDAGYLTEATIPAEYITETELQPKLDEKLNLAGGKMQGDIDMANFRLTNLPKAEQDAQAVNYRQLKEAIAGLGNLFDLKGVKKTFGDLPMDGNKIGDVWYVQDEEVGYIWLDDEGTKRWEKFGPEIDLSGYLEKAKLLSTTGSAIDNTMSQDAITKALEKRLSIEVQTLDDSQKVQARTNIDAVSKTEFKAVSDEVAKKADKAGYAENKNLVTDASGNIVTEDKPTKLPNPNALTFTGGSKEVYDGSAPKTVDIPVLPKVVAPSVGKIGEVADADATNKEIQAVKNGTVANSNKINGYTVEAMAKEVWDTFTPQTDGIYFVYDPAAEVTFTKEV